MISRTDCRAIAVLAAALLAGCDRSQQAAVLLNSGHDIYTAECALCHGREGEGIAPKYPPLKGSAWVAGPPERLAAIILDGLTGPTGKYNGAMPGWHARLNDAQIAAVMTWLRQANGAPPVEPVEVSEVRYETQSRNTFWTVGELQNLRIR